MALLFIFHVFCRYICGFCLPIMDSGLNTTLLVPSSSLNLGPIRLWLSKLVCYEDFNASCDFNLLSSLAKSLSYIKISHETILSLRNIGKNSLREKCKMFQNCLWHGSPSTPENSLQYGKEFCSEKCFKICL